MPGISEVICYIPSMSEFFGDSGLLVNQKRNEVLKKSSRDSFLRVHFRVEIQQCVILRPTEISLNKTANESMDVYRRVLKGE